MRAMVLCGGYGTRLGDLTQQVPKAMLPLAGRPLLEHIIVHLAGHGVAQVAVNLHFLPEQIRDYFGDGSRWGVEIHYSPEPELLGTAGALRKLAPFLAQDDLFLVQYGDILTDQDLAAMVEFHRARDALLTLLVHRRARSNSVVGLDPGGRVVDFLERPDDEARARLRSPWVNSALYLCAAEVLQYLPPTDPCDIPRDLLPRLIPGGRVYGFPLTGYRCAIDSPARLDAARAALAEGRCRPGAV